MLRFVVILLVGIVAWSTSCLAVKYDTDITESEWVVNVSIFECRLVHGIEFYGDAVFYQRAGESQRFVIDSDTPRLKSGQASLKSHAPVWVKHAAGKDMGYVQVRQGNTPIRLDTRLSQRVLTELHQGMEVVFTRRPWYGAEKSVEVAISAVNFRAAYDRYLGCLSGLLPVNFEQIERTSIYFGSSKEALNPSEVEKLDNIGLYFKADGEISQFYVDGHTDSLGSRVENFELARERAEMVTKFLVARGVPPEMIVTRWHGERYPVASNQTRKGRAQNRRVTIRLVKGSSDEEPEFPDETDQMASR
ncbi:flagellar protein MotY [Aurantivibrio plasticivorans]